MSLERPTPRTDAHQRRPHMAYDRLWSDFACMLELEVEDAKQLNRELLDKLEAMQAERDEANEHAAQLEASLLTMTKAATMIVEAYSPQFFRAGKWAQGALDACRDTPVTVEPETVPFHEANVEQKRLMFNMLGVTLPSGGTITVGVAETPERERKIHITRPTLDGKTSELAFGLTAAAADVLMKLLALQHEDADELIVQRTAAECGQYADKHLAPSEKPQPDNEPEAS